MYERMSVSKRCLTFARRYEVFRFLATIAVAIINELFMKEMLVRIGWIAGAVILAVMIVQNVNAQEPKTASRLPALWALATFAPFAVLGLVHLNILPKGSIFRVLRRLVRILL